MIKKIILGAITYCLLFVAISALTVEVNAQKIPNKAKKLKKQGDNFYNKRMYEEAINKYAQAIFIADNYSAAHYWKGNSHNYLEQFDLALEELNKALSQGYEPLEVYRARWFTNYKKQNYDAALDDIKNGLQLDPTNLTFQAGIADVYYSKKDYQEAVNAYVKVVDQIPNNGNSYYNIAFANFSLNNVAEQKIAAQKAIANRTQFVGESYFLIGDAFQKEKNWTAAIDAYQKSLNTAQDKKETYLNLGSIFRIQNRFQEAIDTIKKGIKYFPKDGDFYVDLSWYFSLNDMHKDAVAAAQNAISYAPNNYIAHTNLCRALNDLQNYNLAIDACNNALKLNPGDGETNYYLGRAYASTNREKQADVYYKKSIPDLVRYAKNFPDYADAFYLLGNAYYATDQYEKAIDAYTRTLELSPKFTKAMFNLGVTYFLNKNLPQAKVQYAELLKLDPKSAKELDEIIGKK